MNPLSSITIPFMKGQAKAQGHELKMLPGKPADIENIRRKRPLILEPNNDQKHSIIVDSPVVVNDIPNLGTLSITGQKTQWQQPAAPMTVGVTVVKSQTKNVASESDFTKKSFQLKSNLNLVSHSLTLALNSSQKSKKPSLPRSVIIQTKSKNKTNATIVSEKETDDVDSSNLNSIKLNEIQIDKTQRQTQQNSTEGATCDSAIETNIATNKTAKKIQKPVPAQNNSSTRNDRRPSVENRKVGIPKQFTNKNLVTQQTATTVNSNSTVIKKSQTQQDQVKYLTANNRRRINFVIQFGNNSALVRQALRSMSKIFIPALGDPQNRFGKTSFENKTCTINGTDAFERIMEQGRTGQGQPGVSNSIIPVELLRCEFLWTQYKSRQFLKRMRRQCKITAQEPRNSCNSINLESDPESSEANDNYTHLDWQEVLQDNAVYVANNTEDICEIKDLPTAVKEKSIYNDLKNMNKQLHLQPQQQVQSLNRQSLSTVTQPNTTVKKSQTQQTKNQMMIPQQQSQTQMSSLQDSIEHLNLDPFLPRLFHNHFENNDVLCTKIGLFQTLRKALGSDEKTFEIIPFSVIVKNADDVEQFEKIYSNWRTDKENGESDKNIWLLKPGLFANRGYGIRISGDWDYLNTHLQKKVVQKGKYYLCQKYIEKPFLINGRKFDIRAYAFAIDECQVKLEFQTKKDNQETDKLKVVTEKDQVQVEAQSESESGLDSESGNANRTTKSTLSAYFYVDWYIRTSSCKYSASDFENRVKHLNNDAVQKHGDQYGKFESANKLSEADFQRYLNQQHNNSNEKTSNLCTTKLTTEMKKIMETSIGSAQSTLNPNHIPGCFEFFGFDFMLDSNFRPWLIEINTNPCLELCNSHLASIIPPMISSGIHKATFGSFENKYEKKWEKLNLQGQSESVDPG